MTDPDALYAAILDNPADDTPRLVYADMLDDTGDPGLADRAAFIRCQIELSRDWAGHSDLSHQGTRLCKGCELRRRERALFRARRSEWFGGLSAVLGEWRLQASRPTGFAAGVVHRGFLDDWAGPLAAWVGGECTWCRGRGGWETGPHSEECRRCNGRGTVVGCGPATVAAHPITRVTITDREPNPNSYGGPVVAWQSDHAELMLPSWVPYGLLRHMAVPEGLDGRTWLTYPTRAAALDALSLACVNYARGQAGMSPLEPHKEHSCSAS